jgi:phage terminase large subunit-like protein
MTPRGYLGQGSPDRLDALVWAVDELLLAPARQHRMPRVRMI